MSAFAVLTGGGDCPGLNAAIRAVVRGSIAAGHDVVGHPARLARALARPTLRPLDRRAVSGILPRGGTILGTSRLGSVPRGRRLRGAARDDEEHGIEGVVAIGGDGTLGVAHRLHAEHGYPVVGVPKTIDNDLAGTDVTIGFDTAVHVCTEAIDRIHTTAESHNRVMVVEVMGRDTGWIAPRPASREAPTSSSCRSGRRRSRTSATSSGADTTRAATSPSSSSPRGTRSPGGRASRRRRCMQGVDRYGYARLGGIGQVVADEVTRETGYDTRVTVLGHVQRGGTPTARDRLLATRLGLKAAELASSGTLGPHGGGARQRHRRRVARGGHSRRIDPSPMSGSRRGETVA